MLYFLLFLSLFLNTCAFSSPDISYSKAVVQDLRNVFNNVKPGEFQNVFSFMADTSVYRNHADQFIITRVFLVSGVFENIRVAEQLDICSKISRIDSKVIIKTIVTQEQIQYFLSENSEPMSQRIRHIMQKMFMKHYF